MLVQTGRLPSELPVHVVRGLIWRAYAERALAVIRHAKRPVPDSAPLQERLDHIEVVKATQVIEGELFPDG